MIEPAREQDLLCRARDGEWSAYDALIRAYETIAFRAAYLITRDADEAADAAQEAFVRAHRGLGSFRIGESFRPWLLQIVTNQALNRVTARKRREKMTERYAQVVREDTGSPSPHKELEAREQNEQLMRAVARLSADEQALLSLRYFLELPESDVAQALSIPVGTVKSRLHRTLAKLRGVVEREFPDLKELTAQSE